MTLPPSLVVSVSDYRTREPAFSFLLFSGLMLNYFKLVILNYTNGKHFHSLTFYIELCSKYVGLWLDLALLKIISMVTPDFFFAFLKGKIIYHEIKMKI